MNIHFLPYLFQDTWSHDVKFWYSFSIFPLERKMYDFYHLFHFLRLLNIAGFSIQRRRSLCRTFTWCCSGKMEAKLFRADSDKTLLITSTFGNKQKECFHRCFVLSPCQLLILISRRSF